MNTDIAIAKLRTLLLSNQLSEEDKDAIKMLVTATCIIQECHPKYPTGKIIGGLCFIYQKVYRPFDSTDTDVVSAAIQRISDCNCRVNNMSRDELAKLIARFLYGNKMQDCAACGLPNCKNQNGRCAEKLADYLKEKTNDN